MNTLHLKTICVLAMAVVLVAPGACPALELYFKDFEDDLPGTGMATDVYEFHGSSDGDGFPIISPEVTATSGVGGSQSFAYGFDSSAVSEWYFAGFGSFAVFADDENLHGGGVPGSDDPSRYRVSMDIKVEGSDGTAGSTPLLIRLAAIDGIYEMRHGIDLNGNGDMEDGAAVYISIINPPLVNGGDYTTISWALDQGTIEADEGVPSEHQVFGNNLSFLWQFNWGGEHFGLDAGNMVSVDNVRIEFLEEVPGIPGDYNGNGIVDAADYTVWRDTLGQMGANLAADGTGSGLDGAPDGVVDQHDYDFWKANFGMGAPGSGSSTSAAVPEPSAGALLVMATALIAVRLTQVSRPH